METQTIIEYEVVEPVSDEYFITRSRDRASEHYEKGWTVFEVHKTTTQSSVNAQTQVRVVWRWNNNPEFEEV